MQGFAVDPVYAKGEVFAYVGLPQNLKDLKDPFHRWYPTDLTQPPTHSLTLYLAGHPWLEPLYFNYGIPRASEKLT